MESPTTISESPELSAFDLNTMRATKPGLKRQPLTFSIIISFLLGLPFLLKSVEIYRARINSPLVSVQISICGNCGENYTISITIDLSEIFYDSVKNDHVFDELLRGKSEGSENVYGVVVVSRDEEIRAVVGRFRHALIVGRVSEVNLAGMIVEIFVKIFVNGGKDDGAIHGAYIPSIEECPLQLQLPNRETSGTNGFISPVMTIFSSSSSGLLHDLKNIFEVFMGQFQQLFGLKSDSIFMGVSGLYMLFPSGRGFADCSGKNSSYTGTQLDVWLGQFPSAVRCIVPTIYMFQSWLMYNNFRISFLIGKVFSRLQNLLMRMPCWEYMRLQLVHLLASLGQS
ncbi:hypothetical protein RJ641_021824 [Dillenia turbinata]|uniref:Uncharacterized protein n=1 Tax=Dillenia turbinata TaxID=194707 RepID=A0AAN8UQH8_9MAGN